MNMKLAENKKLQKMNVVYHCMLFDLLKEKKIIVSHLVDWVFDWHGCCSPWGGTPDFKWQGWSKDVFGLEIFSFGICLGRRILASIFWAASFNKRVLGVFKTIWIFMMVISFNAFWEFLWLGKSAWEFLGFKFWSRDFFGFCLML